MTPPPEKVLKLGEEAGEVIGGGEEKSDGIQKTVIPLASRAREKTTRIE